MALRVGQAGLPRTHERLAETGFGDRFVARVDSRLEKGVWTISRWWWEADIALDSNLLDALHVAIENFLQYLRANGINVGEGIDRAMREAVVGVS